MQTHCSGSLLCTKDILSHRERRTRRRAVVVVGRGQLEG